jgi:FAD/FMN-containing dehydrogenase
MTIEIRKRFGRALAIVLLTLVAAVFVTARKIRDYAADPSGEKDCAPDPAPGGADIHPDRVATVAPSPAVPWKQRGGTLNDSSCLNRTAVFGVVKVESPDDVRNALRFARDQHLKVSIAGVRHSQGGQAFAKQAVVLDMTTFNKMRLDESRKVLTVQSGARWHDIQSFLHPRFAVKAMQSTDIFTVGGSITVNAHGMDHRAGSVGDSVRAMRVMLPDGTIQNVSREENAELFSLVVGGYGLFGVILDADLDVVDNVVYQSDRRILRYTEFPELFRREIDPDPRVALMYAHLSTAPQSLLDEMILYTYRTTDHPPATVPPLADVSSVKLRRVVFNLAKLGGPAMRLKWWSEKHLEPRLENCDVSRNQALGAAEGCFVSRNEPMHDSVYYLKNSLPKETDILHEYYVPRDRFVSFVDGMREIMVRRDATLLNASIRIVHQESNLLNYAPTDMFAVVLYLNQTTDRQGTERMATLTRELIDLTIKEGGRFFLPYQLHYTAEQLARAYPEIDRFFDAKRRYDPDLLLTNTFYEKYSRPLLVSTASPRP